MNPETSPLKPAEKLKQKELGSELSTERESSPRERTRQRVIRFMIDRYRESKEKLRIRKELRRERNRLRKLQKAEKRRRDIGEKILRETTKVEK